MLDVRSSIPGISWPGIPNARASQLLAMQFQLEQSQWFPREQIEALQARQLRLLYRHAYDHVPYYKQSFDDAGVPPERLRSAADWLAVPLLTRRDIQAAQANLHSQPPFAAHGPIIPTVTSGSSGQPVTTLTTTVTRLFTSALLLRQHIWHRRDLGLKLATIRSFQTDGENLEQSSNQWGLGTVDITSTGPCVSLDVHTTIQEQAEFLVRHNPGYLLTYPSILWELTRHFEQSGQKLPGLREVRSFGELLEPKVREAVRRVWGVKVVDSYSSQELAVIAVQCPDHEQYHIQAENLLVEVLDEQNQPCAPGQVGRLVITTLHNFAMPLIRYDIGDYGEVGEQCPCGRGLAVLRRIVGRQRHMFVLPDGRKIWPALELTSREHASQLPPVQQFQLIQRTTEQLELLVVAPREFSDLELEIIREWVDRAVGVRLSLKVTYVESIPRGATGKYEDLRSEVLLR